MTDATLPTDLTSEPNPLLLLAQLALESASDQIFWTDAAGRFIYVNPAACAALEYSREELLTLSVYDVSPDFPAERWPTHWAQLKAAGSLIFEAEQRTRTGRKRVVEITTNYLNHQGREFTSGSARDITARKLSERELSESRQQLETLFRESPAAVAITRMADGTFLEVNAAFEELFGFSRGELIGHTTVEKGLCDVAERRRLVDKVRDEGVARNVEIQLRGHDGRSMATHTSAAPLSFRDQDCLLTMVVDVSEQKAIERELREREERLRLIFDTSQAGIILVDPGGKITFANRRMADMFGCPLQKLLGSSYPEHLHPDERVAGEERMRRLIAGEIDHVYTERQYLRGDGTTFWGYLSGRRHEDAQGQLISLMGVIADITDRKEAERALRSSEERFRALIELAADTILQGDPAGNIIGANQSAAALTGYGPEELLRMNVARLFSPEEQLRVPLRYDLLREGKTVRNERLLTRKDGTAVPIEMNTKMMPDGSYQTLIRDFSERKKAEEVLRASEEKFSMVFRRAPLLMGLTAVEDGRCLDVNDKFCEVSGFRRDELLGKTAVEIGWLAAPIREGLIQELDARGRIADREFTLTAKGGRQVHCLYRGELITLDGQRRLLSIALDVTEKVLLQEELAKTQKLESLGVLAGGLAHDFNNILTGILGNLSFARLLVGQEHKAAERLAECEKAAVRASELTQQLLTFARGGAPVKRVVEAARVVREAVSFGLRGSNVKGVVDVPAGLWHVHADEGQLSQVFNNLLINAKQAMPSGGKVTVRGANEVVSEHGGLPLLPGRYVRLDVSDTGSGITPELLGKIFDPYFTTKPGGTGLGLSSVYSIVRRHGGHVQVASAPEEGTTFTLYLPAVLATESAPSRESAETARAQAGQGRILVMDDEEMIRDLAGNMLEALGYVAVPCPDGAAAVELFREALARGNPFDAVLLDLTVPGGMGGREAAARIREIDEKAVLIVSSGYSNDPILADFRAFGFAGAVAKPYSMDRLAQALSHLLAKGPVPTGPTG